jgi:exosome complex RNA-binding protein Csl4
MMENNKLNLLLVLVVVLSGLSLWQYKQIATINREIDSMLGRTFEEAPDSPPIASVPVSNNNVKITPDILTTINKVIESAKTVRGRIISIGDNALVVNVTMQDLRSLSLESTSAAKTISKDIRVSVVANTYFPFKKMSELKVGDEIVAAIPKDGGSAYDVTEFTAETIYNAIPGL